MSGKNDGSIGIYENGRREERVGGYGNIPEGFLASVPREGSVTRGRRGEEEEKRERFSSLSDENVPFGWIECRLIRHSFIIDKNTGRRMDSGPIDTRFAGESSPPRSSLVSSSCCCCPSCSFDTTAPRFDGRSVPRLDVSTYERLIHKTARFARFGPRSDPQGRWKR